MFRMLIASRDIPLQSIEAIFLCRGGVTLVIVEGPAVDWIAGGLEMNVLKGFAGTPVRFR